MCFLILAGKNSTFDGCIMGAHNDEVEGHNASKIVKTGPSGANDAILPHLLIEKGFPCVKEPGEILSLQISRGFIEGDVVGINEKKVALMGGVTLQYDKNDFAESVAPLSEKGISGYARYFALQDSETARECIEKMGDMYDRYGISYPCGVAVADENEIWYIESVGGKFWAACRIPDESIFVQANGFRLNNVHLEDGKDHICSPELKRFIHNDGKRFVQKDAFNMAAAFGGHSASFPGRESFNSRRLWGALEILAPSENIQPDTRDFPLFVKPDTKVTPEIMVKVLRHHYEGTPYDPFSEAAGAKLERSIAVQYTVHSDIVTIKKDLPADIGCLMFAATGSPLVTPYIPYFLGTESFLDPFVTAMTEYCEDSAFWRYRNLMTLVQPYYSKLKEYLMPDLLEFESEQAGMIPGMEREAFSSYHVDPEGSRRQLSDFSMGRGKKALEMLDGHIRNINTLIARNSNIWQYLA